MTPLYLQRRERNPRRTDGSLHDVLTLQGISGPAAAGAATVLAGSLAPSFSSMRRAASLSGLISTTCSKASRRSAAVSAQTASHPQACSLSGSSTTIWRRRTPAQRISVIDEESIACKGNIYYCQSSSFRQNDKCPRRRIGKFRVPARTRKTARIAIEVRGITASCRNSHLRKGELLPYAIDWNRSRADEYR